LGGGGGALFNPFIPELTGNKLALSKPDHRTIHNFCKQMVQVRFREIRIQN
jgi:hypothetical protein